MTNEPKHKTTSTDEMVGLTGGGERLGTVSRCICGWKSSWWIRDGSAEADAHKHMRTRDPEFRARDDEYRRNWHIENDALQEEAKARREAYANSTPKAPDPPREPCHECRCHYNPPCSPCENCLHMAGGIDCDEDCQTCEVDHNDEY